MKAIATEFGARAVVWRYDPIVFTDHTPPAWHLANFTQFAAKLAGSVDEVTVAFAQAYRKTRRNLERAVLKGEFRWEASDADTKRARTQRLGVISITHQMQLTVCSQKALVKLKRPLPPISTRRGYPRSPARRLPRNKAAIFQIAFCHASPDIDAYDIRRHDSNYCHAVSDTDKAKRNFAAHGPKAERL